VRQTAHQTVFDAFAAVMAVAFVVTLAKMPRGRVRVEEAPSEPADSSPGPA
jgi:hypothetical protein